jgi:hypothetical protein
MRRMIWRLLLLAALVAANSAPLRAAEARILKVLPHLLDAKGRNALAPSLFERDAYQAYLRQNPAEISALRFDVQYKAPAGKPLVLRIELRGAKMAIGQSRVFETDIEPRRLFSSWGELHLGKKLYDEIGQIQAWRATLRDGDLELAELTSFLW